MFLVDLFFTFVPQFMHTSVKFIHVSPDPLLLSYFLLDLPILYAVQCVLLSPSDDAYMVRALSSVPICLSCASPCSRCFSASRAFCLVSSAPPLPTPTTRLHHQACQAARPTPSRCRLLRLSAGRCCPPVPQGDASKRAAVDPALPASSALHPPPDLGTVD
mmetsp:Transcript_39942/g.106788  ORF Transcript_39942/g.106788 Transcript_39942/m.106788 type:complete len:161 (+) Transcript_39942:1234-1716(+)